MKKCIGYILTITILLALVLCGCGKKNDKEKEKETAAFTAPKEYASVVQVTINPTVNLYLDKDEKILAVEYVNADAKECYSKVESKLVGSKLEDGVNMVIETAEADGYLAKNKEVTIDVIETKQTEQKLEILSVATEAAKTFISEKKIEAEVVLTKATQKEVDDKAAADKAAADKAAADKAAADKAAADKAAADKAAADKAAADKAAAEKAAAEKEKKNPMKSLKKNVEYIIFKPNEDETALTCFVLRFHDYNEYSYGEAPYTLDQYGEGASTVYNGKTYYLAGGGAGGEGTYSLTDERITLIEDEMVFTMTTDGKLVVEKINSYSDFFKVGDVLATK